MTTTLAAQLARIAVESKSTLNVKAQKAAHSKSLLFEPRVASSQSFQSLYTICSEGFEELCQLDGRFAVFRMTLFSQQSQDEDRSQMTAAENTELDKRIESFLRLAGGWLRLMPAIKALEWLIRRFRIHEHNTGILITTFLPYFSIPAFATLLSILPKEVPRLYRFLNPYIRSATQPPRAALVHQAIHHPEFLAAISDFTLESCKHLQHHPSLISFWGGIMIQAVNGILDKNRSGRLTIQKSNDQALLQQIGPTLSTGLVAKAVPDLQVSSYMVVITLVAKGGLDDDVITSIMEQLVSGWTTQTLQPGVVCLVILAGYRARKKVSRSVAKALLKVANIVEILAVAGKEYDIENLSTGFCLALIDRIHKKGDAKGLAIIEDIVGRQMLNREQLTVIFKALLLSSHKIRDQMGEKRHARQSLASCIVKLSQSGGETGAAFSKAVNDTQVDIEALEMRLEMVIPPKLKALKDEEKETVTLISDQPDFDLGDDQVNVRSDCSFLSHSPPGPELFMRLCSMYLSSVDSPEGLKTFDQIKLLQRDRACKSPFYCTFFIRIWSGPYPTLARVNALELVKGRLKRADFKDVDVQAIIPYCLTALSDPAKKVRSAAADLLVVLEEILAQCDSKVTKRWCVNTLYNGSDGLAWMTDDISRRFLTGILAATLEECVLNADHISSVLQMALHQHKGAKKDKKSRLSHGARLSVLSFLASHIIQTPLLTTKLRLLRPLNQVKGVSGTSRTEVLLPLLQWWVALSVDQGHQVCVREYVDESAMDQSAVDIVIPNDKEGVDFLLASLQKPEISARENLVRAIFGRLGHMWPSMRTDMRQIAAESLLALTQAGTKEPSLISDEAAGLLKSVELTTDLLLSFLYSLQGVAQMAVDPSAGKRRRTSSSGRHQGAPDLGVALKRSTFVLELVEGSEPRKHPRLLDALFHALSELQQLRALVGSELGYLQNLILRSLLAMMPAYKADQSLKIQGSGGYGDLLVDSIQKSSSPSVQTTALLLVASLANIAPDLVLDSVMPIFTFMGSSVLRQSDDYSAHVINQTVKEVVPPLIQSLRKGKKGPVAGASDLLLSFVTAYEHIPSHRRLRLFISLVETLGPHEFLFALLAMLIDKYVSTKDVLLFASELFDHFSVHVQLQSIIHLLHLIGGVLQSKPGNLAVVLLGTGQGTIRDQQKTGLSELNLAIHLLSGKRLSTHIAKSTVQDDMDAAKVRELYANLLEDLLLLAGNVKQHETIVSRCGDALAKVLRLLPLAEFIKAVDNLLDKPDGIIRRKVLGALEVRIDQESQANAESRLALLAFLPTLTAIIRDSDDMFYKHIALGCVDKIAEKYGKKDPEAVTAAATTIAGNHCLGQTDARLRVMALLCLASLVDVLQEGIVPVLPLAIPKCLTYMRASVQPDKKGAELHNAGYAFMSALAQHLPYMVSGSYLDSLLAISAASAQADLNADAVDARLECLQLLAKQVEGKVMFTALEANWATAADAGYVVSMTHVSDDDIPPTETQLTRTPCTQAIKEYLEITGMAIDKHSKADIARSVGPLATIFLSAFDLRRMQHLKGDSSNLTSPSLSLLQELTNSMALRMVYKLNDAAFRPLFSNLMDWTTALPKSDQRGRNLRLLSVFSFLHVFFDGLKSIVTSYASYVIDPAVAALNTTTPRDAETRELWSQALRVLAKTFEHDQDDFWQAPAHFNAVAQVLAAQFAHGASSVMDRISDDLIPAVVELTASADSKEHQKTLNTALLKQLRDSNPGVRLAVVLAQQKLTERLGEDWLEMLPEMLPYISELQEDDDEVVERETHRWIVGIEGVLGESLDAMLQ